MTAILGEMAIKLGLKVRIMLPREALLEQQANRFFDGGLPKERCTILAGGRNFDPDAQVWICSQQTLSRRMDWLRELPDSQRHALWIIDEAHDTSFSKPGLYVLSKESGVIAVIGMTATPYNLGTKRNLRDLYDVVSSINLSKPELNAAGYTAPVKYRVMPKDGAKPELSGVGKLGGEYKSKELAVACDQPQLIEHLLDETTRVTGGELRTLSFAVNVAHANSIHQAVLQRGWSSAVLTGETPPAERQAMYKDFKVGSLLYLNSCECLTLGFDAPEAVVALCARPTLSKALWHQMCGRVGRPAPWSGKTHGIVFDQPGNCLKLDVPETRTGPYGFEPDKTNRKAGKEGLPMKACPECGLLQSNFRLECEECGYEFPKADKITTGREMVELDITSKIKNLEQTRERKLQSLLKTAMRNGYMPQWAGAKFAEIYGGWPDKQFLLHRLFPTPTREDASDYLRYLAGVANKKGRDRLWINNQFQTEFGTSFWVEDIVKADPMLSVLPVMAPASNGVLAALRSA